MKTRQYIGARYVPIFAGEWVDNRRYEPLTIVTFGGNSYTSTKEVPVGVNIYNNKYWVNTGNFNAQLHEVYNHFNEYDAIFQSFANQSFIPNLDTFTNNVLVIGDSYNNKDRTQFIENGVTVWGNHLKNLLGYNTENYKNVGVSGAGWTVGTTFRTIVQEHFTSDTPYSKVIIVGGINDVMKAVNDNFTFSVIKEQIKRTVDYIHNISPYTEVYIGVCGYTWNEKQARLKTLVDIISNINDVDFVFLNGVQYAMIGKNFVFNDYVHPTDEASMRIAKGIYQCIKGKTVNYNTEKTIQATVGTNTLNFITTRITNDVFEFNVMGASFNLSSYKMIETDDDPNNVNKIAGGTYDLKICELPDFDYTFNSNYFTHLTPNSLLANTSIRCITRPIGGTSSDNTMCYGSAGFYIKTVHERNGNGDIVSIKNYLMLRVTLLKEADNKTSTYITGNNEFVGTSFNIPNTHMRCSSLIV